MKVGRKEMKMEREEKEEKKNEDRQMHLMHHHHHHHLILLKTMEKRLRLSSSVNSMIDDVINNCQPHMGGGKAYRLSELRSAIESHRPLVIPLLPNKRRDVGTVRC